MNGEKPVTIIKEDQVILCPCCGTAFDIGSNVHLIKTDIETDEVVIDLTKRDTEHSREGRDFINNKGDSVR